MKTLIVLSTLRLNSSNDDVISSYLTKVKKTLSQIDATIVLCLDRWWDSAEKQMTSICKYIWWDYKYVQLEHKPTLLSTLSNIREVLKSEWHDSFERIHVITPSIQVCKEMILTTKYLSWLVWYTKSEEEIYEAIIDIMKSMDSSSLTESKQYKLWKFMFHSIHCQWSMQDAKHQIFSTARELLCDRYPSLEENYINWKSDIKN